MKRVKLDRRQVGAGLAAALAMPFVVRIGTPSAQAQGAGGSIWPQLSDLSQEAQKLGLSVPRMGLAPSSSTEEFSEIQPAIVDFMDGVTASAPDSGASSADVDGLLDRASELLRTARNAERAPRDIPEGPQATAITRPNLADIADDYRKLFDTCVIRDANRSEVQWYVSKITDASRRKSYEAVAEETCVPWYFTAIIHGMECSFDMTSHLHNGDPLKAKTRQVPAGRPNPWLPPSDWVSSACDAIRYDKLDEKADWDLASILYRWEGYNGWRSRLLYKINTPYLWSFSNHYTKGKFVADNVWDGNAVSKQCGAAVMLKALVEGGFIARPA